MKVAFSDGEKIGVFDGEKTRYFESEAIVRYKEYVSESHRNDEWKFGGEGAKFRGDYDVYRARQEKVTAYVNGVLLEGNNVVYTFTVNNSSGAYRKDYTDEKRREEHIYTSSDCEFLSLAQGENKYFVTVRRDPITSDIGALSVRETELETFTSGDSRDANPYPSPVDRDLIFFDSAGVGRDAQGNFTGTYAPACLYTLRQTSQEIEEFFGDGKNSYIKPKQAKDGTVYCIKRPNKEKRGGNPFLEILLIPVRIVQAIASFLQAFVQIFTGKSLTSGGSNPAKGREVDSRKMLVDGNLIEAEKEYKRNQKFKDKEYGFIPLSWKLVKIKDGKAEEVESGVCDFSLDGEGGVYYTNGKHVFYLKEGKKKKIADTDCCLALSASEGDDSALPAEEKKSAKDEEKDTFF